MPKELHPLSGTGLIQMTSPMYVPSSKLKVCVFNERVSNGNNELVERITDWLAQVDVYVLNVTQSGNSDHGGIITIWYVLREDSEEK